MARSDTRYREAYNRILDYCGSLPVGAAMPAESALSDIAEVSRTVIRRCLGRLEEEKLISWVGREKRILRKPTEADRIDLPESGASPRISNSASSNGCCASTCPQTRRFRWRSLRAASTCRSTS